MYENSFYGNIGFGDWSVTIGNYPPFYAPYPYPATNQPVYTGSGFFAMDSTMILLLILICALLILR